MFSPFKIFSSSALSKNCPPTGEPATSTVTINSGQLDLNSVTAPSPFPIQTDYIIEFTCVKFPSNIVLGQPYYLEVSGTSAGIKESAAGPVIPIVSTRAINFGHIRFTSYVI